MLGADAATAEPLVEDPDRVAPATWDDGIELTLSQLVKDSETRASGRVQVMTIAHLRHQLGDDWTRYRDRVLLIAESTIGRMIGKGNTFIPQDEDSWLLLMPALSEADAARRADEIAALIGEKLVGERFSEAEPPLPQSAKIDLGGALNADGSLNREAMKAAVKRSRLLLAARDARRPVKLIGDAAPAAAKSPVSALDSVAASRSRFNELTLVYRPSWSADTESFDTFSLRAFDATGEAVFGPTDSQTAVNVATMVDIAKSAFADFTRLAASALRAKFVMPLPFALLHRKLGAAFLRAVSALPQKERLLHLRIEIVGLPADADVDALIAAREMFRGRVREVALLTDLAQPQRAAFLPDHILIGAEIPPGRFAAEAELKAALADFRRAAGTRRAYVMGLRSRSHAALAVEVGLDEVSGIGLADDHRHLPERVIVLPREKLTAP
ncbi:MAG: hypothetical protein SFV21_06355 [Rhodospirillaceae bacterium]|nr:hypothetical protein [Rhodospirillaceae bacterium]